MRLPELTPDQERAVAHRTGKEIAECVFDHSTAARARVRRNLSNSYKDSPIAYIREAALDGYDERIAELLGGPWPEHMRD